MLLGHEICVPLREGMTPRNDKVLVMRLSLSLRIDILRADDEIIHTQE
jgi:hypothetical protein